jgi:hypothetical protein
MNYYYYYYCDFDGLSDYFVINERAMLLYI